jgi:asparagine synthase (glutamine-hydrolysing)
LSGICGWHGDAGEDPRGVIEAMKRRFTWRDAEVRTSVVGARFGLAAVGPPGTAAVAEVGPICIAVQGHPSWQRGVSNSGSATSELDDFCRRAVDAYLDHGSEFLADIGNDFALALIDSRRPDDTVLAIDRMGVRNLVYEHAHNTLIFGASSDVVLAHPLARGSVDPQALYDYVYFHMVPGPTTAYREQARLKPGHRLTLENAQLKVQPYWQIRFTEPKSGRVADFKSEFRAALDMSVTACVGGAQCGAFLSGGTDSSTIAGMLGRVAGVPARTYSIGFAAAGYDEMEYARTTARFFGTDHHEYYVTPDDVVQAVPLIAAAYDQPFGNASAIPTYYCARLAHADGVRRLLGGDGGDELFGGNTRYAKQYQFGLYDRIPAALRHGLLEPVLHNLPGLAGIPILGKVRSYVAQASLPMPARLESYNLLERLGPENVFSADFLASVDRHAPLARLAATYDSIQAASLINRMLGLDLKFTLADNDLPKVTRTCDVAAVDVAFPLLHESIVDFSTTLPPHFKLRGTKLRYFFKEALRDFLPPETITKKKHGFGLPAGLWLRDYAPLNQLAGDSLASLRRRGIFRKELFDTLMTDRLRDHPGYYGTLVWVLMMLELWFEAHASSSAKVSYRHDLAR